MTSPKQLETVSGAVEQVNAKGSGIKVLGEWLNVSQYHPISPMPTPGELVNVQFERTDRGAWITSLQIIDVTARELLPIDRQIRRMSALRSAAAFCAGKAVSSDVSSKDVLAVVTAFLAWLERDQETVA